MAAIKAIAKRTKSGKYKIILSIDSDAEEINLMIVLPSFKKELQHLQKS
jgi:mRNA-degrading endonuclease RelE of RelBE toxin-antitoxin system